ncbi:MAG: RIP metalloprotease RseP [Chitinophagaceae bacterium]|jgi:regulator of sigma E protease|nr:RIP metalloprotease RseP [Chitinophagaceae bacterium]
MTQILAIDWGVFGVRAGQLLLSLSILVILHEFGHYITAKWFKCRVEKFYLFFDPWFSLVKKKVGDTEYGIGWLPLGGYVKIAGMIDESMDKSALEAPAQPWEFRSKPAWQRLIIMIGGVTVNILLAFVIYAGILMYWGEKKVPNDSVKYGISIQDSLIYGFGLKNGDKIVAANGEKIDDFNETIGRMLVSRELTVERDGKQVKLQLPEDLIGQLMEKKKGRSPLLSPRIPAVVSQLDTTMAAYKAGLQKGDVIVNINGKPTPFFDVLKSVVDENAGKMVAVQYLRNADTLAANIQISKEGRLGFATLSSREEYVQYNILEEKVTKYGFFAAFPAGVKLAIKKLGEYYEQFKLIFQPKTGAYKGIGGFYSMGKIFAPVWDWESFWTFTAFLSIVLAFMNMLPIPALDGGHVVFTLIEMITGRKPNQKFLEVAQVIGMVLLLGLMLYANLNDFIGWGRDK